MKKLMITPFIIMATASAFAIPVTLYTQPNTHSAKLAKVDSNQIKPFFAKGNWIKVGDANTGNVGWVENKSSQPSINTAQVNQQLASIQEALTEAKQAKAQFDQEYRNTMHSLDQKQQTLIKQLNMQQPITIDSGHSFTETIVSYSGNGGDGKVHITKKWVNKDGKLETKTSDIPIQAFNKQNMTQDNSIQSNNSLNTDNKVSPAQNKG